MSAAGPGRKDWMTMWWKQKTTPYTIVIGCGPLGEQLAREIDTIGDTVLVVDISEEALCRLAALCGGNLYGGEQITGDARKREVLDRINMRKATTVVLATGSENTNILVSQLAKEEYHVPDVIAISADPNRRFLYEDWGIHTVQDQDQTAEQIMAYYKAKKGEP